jgi:hypothetical protein
MAVNLKATTLTRRQAIAGAVIAFASVTVSAAVWARAQQPAMKEAPSRPENQARTTIHEEVAFEASPQRIYEALVDSKQFAAFSGMPAEIDAKAGGAFSMFGGTGSQVARGAGVASDALGPWRVLDRQVRTERKRRGKHATPGSQGIPGGRV